MVYAQGGICEEAIEITEGTIQSDGPILASGAYNECWSLGENAIWYVYYPIQSGLATVDASGFLGNRVKVYSGSCDSLVCETVDGGSSWTAVVTFEVPQGEPYYIEWDDRWRINEFDFALSMQKFDDCPMIPYYP